MASRASDLLVADYFPAPMDDDDNDVDVEQQDDDGRTPLDRTIDRIGMGSYQWTLVSLCGFGWLADNMWLQAVAIILPRVQQHYSVQDSLIGTLSSSMFAGMMLGAFGWGTCSDLMGRSTAFNATLFFTAVFGLLASFAGTFFWLCVALFFLGTAVGGSIPTDGTLLLEHMPRGKQYLVTALSVFFSLGSVLAAVVGIIFIPRYSCPHSSSSAECDVNKENLGWKYVLMALGLITLAMFLARMLFFRLHESPRYLVHAGRPQEALVSLRLISRFNGSELALGLNDVRDHRYDLDSADASAKMSVVFDAEAGGLERGWEEEREGEGEIGEQSALAPERIDYHATGESPTPLDAHSFATPITEIPTPTTTTLLSPFPITAESRPKEDDDDINTSRSRRSSRYTPHPHTRPLPRALKTLTSHLPHYLHRPLSRLAFVLTPEWRRTTLLIWAIWCAMALAYTMFNVFLPKLLETRTRGDRVVLSPGEGEEKGLEETMWDVMIFTLGGCPGAILGAYLIKPLGRRLALTGNTFLTVVFCVAFVYAESAFAVRASTVGISLSSTTMWAVLYGWTPAIFSTKVRGTACGTASALSRIGGMAAPMLGGVLLAMGRSVPVYASVGIFCVAGVCVLMLREDEGAGADKVDNAESIVIVH